MCGQVGWLSKNPSTKVQPGRAAVYVMDQFQNQAKRGLEGFGITEIYEDGFVNILRATREVKMTIDLMKSEAKHILLHHRNPTSSNNTLDQTHPITVEHEELEFVWNVNHNGTIQNKLELKRAHEALGYVYLTEYKEAYGGHVYGESKFNDTESFAIELARFLEGKSDNIAAKGGFAFMAVATDKKGLVKKVYIGGNGYGALNLSDNGAGYMFASEEKGGATIEDDTAIRFDAVYGPSAEGEMLMGFDMVKEPIKLLYPTKLIESPLSSEFAGRSNWNTHRHRAGFHDRSPKAPAASPSAKKDDEEKSIVNFSSYAHIVAYVGRGKLGEVFQDIDMARHEAIEQFDLKAFDDFIAAGKVEKAEDVYNKFVEDMPSWLDADDVLDHHMQPLDIKVTTSPTVNETIEGFRDVSKKRMSAMAKEYLPIFLLASYCECVITLAYQYQTDEAHKQEEEIRISKLPETEQIKERDKQVDEFYSKKGVNPDLGMDQELPGEKVGGPPDDDEGEFDKDIAEIFPGPKKEEKRQEVSGILASLRKRQAGPVNRDDERTYVTFGHNGEEIIYDTYEEYKAAHPEMDEPEHNAPIVVIPKVIERRMHLDTPTEALDNDAGSSLQALAESASEMYPEDIYTEAENVGNTIRVAAEACMLDQLRMVETIASEEGKVMKIPFYFTKMDDEMRKVRARFETLGHIVKAAQIKEGIDKWEESGHLEH